MSIDRRMNKFGIFTHGILLNNKENKLLIHTTGIGSHEHAELKEPGTKEYLLYDSIYVNFRNRQTQTMVTEVRRVVTSSIFYKKLINLFIIYFWLCWVFVAVHRLSLVAASCGSSCCRAQALGEQAQ